MRKQFIVLFLLCLLVAALVNCTKNDLKISDASAFKALPSSIVTPADNPQTNQKINLGKLLFWDPVISGGKDVACASCHHASLGYTDNLDVAIGSNGTGLGTVRHFLSPNDIAFTKRNTPSIVNTAFNGIDVNGICDPVNAVMFFDNRVKSLEKQSIEPIRTLEEMMGHNFTATTALDSIVARLKAIPEYVQLFVNVFGSNAITADNLGKAIACFERTIIANNSPYDRYIRGDASAMSSAQVKGMALFQNDGCIKCHNGPMFSDFAVHVLSVPDNPKLPTDAGFNGTYAFRTPALRNLAVTAPYMHNGMISSLNQVLDFYDKIGAGRSQNPRVAANKLDANLRGINADDKGLIIEFLNALNDNSFDKSIPVKVPSNLHVGGNL